MEGGTHCVSPLHYMILRLYCVFRQSFRKQKGNIKNKGVKSKVKDPLRMIGQLLSDALGCAGASQTTYCCTF